LRIEGNQGLQFVQHAGHIHQPLFLTRIAVVEL
jgi:hypothetical protein